MLSISNVLLIYSVEAQAFLPSISTLFTMADQRQNLSEASLSELCSTCQSEAKPESEASLRFRAKMHAYDAHHKQLQEGCYARAEIVHRKWLRERNEQRDLRRAVGRAEIQDH